MRRFGTGLFLLRAALYKARALREPGRKPARRSLLQQGIERNLEMAVALSIVVPVKDEAENVTSLAREIAAAAKGEDAEIVFVDDGSTDSTIAILTSLKTELPALRVISHGRNIGQSRAIRSGVRAARGAIVVTLDGDGQNDPADIPRLLEVLRAGGGKLGMVSGVRVRRNDDANKRFASGFANRFRRRLLHDGAVDSGCGLKAFRREAYLALPYFDNMHRFLIALAQREGYEVKFVDVNHRAREHGKSKYNNLGRALVGLVDVFGVRWLQHRYRGPAEPEEV
jgi:glycosyltransferase involved in cell wall biosynthesis